MNLIIASFITLFFSLELYAQGLPNGIKVFDGTDPQLPGAQLAGIIDPVIGNKPFIAIGESLHGTAEYTRLQHRLLKYLVQKKGFRIFVLENPLLRSTELTAAVSKCDTTALPMSTLYFPQEEDQDLFEWIRSYNCANPGDPIIYRGIDIWDRFWELQSGIESYAKTLKVSDHETRVAALKKNCVGHSAKNWQEMAGMRRIISTLGRIPEEMFKPCSDTLVSLMSWTETEIKKNPTVTWALLHRFYQLLNTAHANQDFLNHRYRNFPLAWAGRDLGMARNIRSVWSEYGMQKKVVFIGHTSHTSHMRSPSDWWGLGALRSAVSIFRELYQYSPATIMLTSYHSTGGQGDWLDPVSPESLDLFLHKTGHRYLSVDPGSEFVRSKKRWWLQNENAEPLPSGVHMVPKDNFDLFLFIDETLKGRPAAPWVSPYEW